MSTAAEATPDGGQRNARSRVPSASPLMSPAWLLRTAAFSAVAAAAMGLIVAPGVRGNAPERVVVAMDKAASALTFFLVEVLVTVLLWGAVELVRARGSGVLGRSALIASGGVVVALSAPGLRERLPPAYAVLIAAATTVATIAGAHAAARAPHTRALAGVLFTLAFAQVARLAAWELATAAGDRASVQLFAYSRWLATAGVLLEASAQMIAVTWLGTRSRSAGQLGSTAALILAFVATWGVARGTHPVPAMWQAVLRTALSDAPGIPPPYGLDAVATFLVPASLLLALASAAQPKQVAAVTAAMALALVSRGSFDAPLRAFCAVAAAQWAALAGVDQHAMWRTLVNDRKTRLAEEAAGESDRPSL
jgi:hypothetical protein